MHENAARAKTPHAHKSPTTAPLQNLFGLRQKRTNSQHKSKFLGLDAEMTKKTPRNGGGASRARDPANDETNSIASVPHRPPVSRATTTKRQRSLARARGIWHLVLPSACQDCAVHMGRVRTCPPLHSESTSEGDVNRQLSSVMQWQAAGEHLDCSLVGDVNIHVPERCITSNGRSCLAADASEASFRAQCP